MAFPTAFGRGGVRSGANAAGTIGTSARQRSGWRTANFIACSAPAEMFPGIQHVSKIAVILGQFLHICDETFHANVLDWLCLKAVAPWRPQRAFFGMWGRTQACCSAVSVGIYSAKSKHQRALLSVR
jgi:hypothetical protein